MGYSINISEMKEIEKTLLASKVNYPKNFGKILLINFIVFILLFYLVSLIIKM